MISALYWLVKPSLDCDYDQRLFIGWSIVLLKQMLHGKKHNARFNIFHLARRTWEQKGLFPSCHVDLCPNGVVQVLNVSFSY